MRKGLYKTQFVGAESFNDFRWVSDVDDLKYILRCENKGLRQYLLETGDSRDTFYCGDLERMIAAAAFRVKIK